MSELDRIYPPRDIEPRENRLRRLAKFGDKLLRSFAVTVDPHLYVESSVTIPVEQPGGVLFDLVEFRTKKEEARLEQLIDKLAAEKVE